MLMHVVVVVSLVIPVSINTSTVLQTCRVAFNAHNCFAVGCKTCTNNGEGWGWEREGLQHYQQQLEFRTVILFVYQFPITQRRLDVMGVSPAFRWR